LKLSPEDQLIKELIIKYEEWFEMCPTIDDESDLMMNIMAKMILNERELVSHYKKRLDDHEHCVFVRKS
jgi:hypothetical protein